MMRRLPDARPARTGFTLVEMLVSVAIVSLMMVLFAQVFALSARSVGTQKGIARNDQRSRVLLNVLRGDLDNRTFQTILPFGVNEMDGDIVDASSNPLPEFAFANRRGYFYVSENDLASDVDDVLQFTIAIDESENDLLFGTAAVLDLDGDGDPTTPNLNQPDWDDGSIANVGSSRFAEVCYFVRNGVLYRRVMLLRDPLDSSFDANPTGWNAAAHTGSFYADFDYSAHYDTTDGAARFHDLNWLDNASTNTNSLGVPRFRFGHDHATGYPREFANPAVPSVDGFIGRYTHSETSDVTFEYPDALGGTVPNPNDRSDLTGVTFPAGSRVGEDILMQNVHAFDVKVWDDASGGGIDSWRDVGHGGVGTYGVPAASADYGPSSVNANNRVFDTWHPSLTNAPPYRPSPLGADGAPGQQGVDDDGDGTTDNGSEYLWIGSDDVPPLRAIQITVRFFDNKSGQMRQATVRHALFSNRND